jgi:endo-1,4-beta-xylanase
MLMALEYTGKILFDDLSVTYPVKVTMVENGGVNESLEFKLYPNFPNPFNPKTKLKFSISHSASNYDVEVVIYDLLGRKVKEFLIGRLNPGVYELELEAMELASGVYFCVLRAGKFYDSIKIIALK